MNHAYGTLLGNSAQVENRRHMATRFPGLDRHDTLLVSMQPNLVRPAIYGPVTIDEDADASAGAGGGASERTRMLLDAALGRSHTPAELAEHIRAREGARALPSMQATDLFSTGAWIENACSSLSMRGMISGNDDVLVTLIHDAPYGLCERVAELASQRLNAAVDRQFERLVAAGSAPRSILERSVDTSLPRERQQALLQDRQRAFRHGLFSQVARDLKMEDLQHYGPANLKLARTKLTYTNQAQEADAIVHKPPKKRTAPNRAYAVNGGGRHASNFSKMPRCST
jgi:hypothetical protein